MRRLAGLCLLAMIASPAWALDEYELLRAVEEHSPRLAEARAAIAAAHGLERQSALWPNPMLELENDDTRLDPFDAGTGTTMGVVGQPLPISGRIGRAREAARRDRELRELEYEVARHALYMETHAIWVELLWLGESGRLVGESMDRLDALGQALPPDATALDRQRVALERALVEQQLVLLATQGTLARERLRGLMGGDPPSLSNLDGQLERALRPSETAIQNLPRVQAHVEFLRAEGEVALASARLAEARAARWPDVTVRAGIGVDRTEDEAMGMVGVAIPLPLIGRAQGTIAAREAELVAAEARLAATQARLHGELLSLLALLNELDTLAGVYREGHVPAAVANWQSALAEVRASRQGATTTALDAARLLDQVSRQELAYRRDLTATLWKFRHFLRAEPVADSPTNKSD